jgi:hypothetical protein
MSFFYLTGWKSGCSTHTGMHSSVTYVVWQAKEMCAKSRNFERMQF